MAHMCAWAEVGGTCNGKLGCGLCFWLVLEYLELSTQPPQALNLELGWFFLTSEGSSGDTAPSGILLIKNLFLTFLTGFGTMTTR